MQFLLTKEARWYRVALFVGLFVLLPVFLEQAWTSYNRYSYQNAPIENYFKAESLEVENLCVGDTTQHFRGVRHVYKTDSGWSATISRELYKVERTGNKVKVHDEQVDIFIERMNNGVSEREAAIPPLKEGLYQWSIVYVRLYLPFNVVRVDIPVLTSNVFSVEDCNK